MRRFLRRFQSTSTTVAHNSPANASLDLDFVLNLLEHSSSSSSAGAASVMRPSVSTPKWTRMKFKVIEPEVEELLKVEEEENNLKESSSSFASSSSIDSFLNLFENTKQISPTDTLSRLQSLADSLPTQIYDRHGNLIPLNTSKPPSSFFEIDTSRTLNNQQLQQQQQQQLKSVPIFHRDNVDWSRVSITSILKKIVPEEAFLKFQSQELTEDVNCENNNVIDDKKVPLNNVTFNQNELRLLDRDQLHALAKHFRLSCDRQTDLKIENELISIFKLESEPKRPKKTEKVEPEKICWTEENESLLINLYEEVRLEKQKVDQKFATILGLSSVPLSSLKRGNKASERGLWAVLADRMRLASKSHVSVSECRNKLIILKRLKI